MGLLAGYVVWWAFGFDFGFITLFWFGSLLVVVGLLCVLA